MILGAITRNDKLHLLFIHWLRMEWTEKEWKMIPLQFSSKPTSIPVVVVFNLSQGNMYVKRAIYWDSSQIVINQVISVQIFIDVENCEKAFNAMFRWMIGPIYNSIWLIKHSWRHSHWFYKFPSGHNSSKLIRHFSKPFIAYLS